MVEQSDTITVTSLTLSFWNHILPHGNLQKLVALESTSHAAAPILIVAAIKSLHLGGRRLIGLSLGIAPPLAPGFPWFSAMKTTKVS